MPDVILKDRNGKDVTYEGVAAVRLDTPDGGTRTFVAGESEVKTVELDFSMGDMEVVPSAGKLLEKISIPKPDALLPENIAEGVTIAGIVGNLASGGNVKIAYGRVTDSATSVTVDHGLGVVPDLVIAYRDGAAISNYLLMAIATSKDFKNATGFDSQAACSMSSSSSTKTNFFSSMTAWDEGNIYVPIRDMTETSFTLGTSYYYSSTLIRWVAIAGLV